LDVFFSHMARLFLEIVVQKFYAWAVGESISPNFIGYWLLTDMAVREPCSLVPLQPRVDTLSSPDGLDGMWAIDPGDRFDCFIDASLRRLGTGQVRLCRSPGS